MRALRFHRTGDPAKILQLDDVPTPDPGPGEVRVRLTHRSINPADLSTVRGTYGLSPDLPAVGGNEGVGVVDALGDEVADLSPGQRVVPIGAGPTWREALVTPPDRLLPVPDGVPDEAAAQLVVNPLTAWLLLWAVPHLTHGDWVIQSAGASAVAKCVIQLARRRGVRIVSVVRSPDHEAALREMGAEVVMADANTKAARTALREIVGRPGDGGGAQAAFDPVLGDIGVLLQSALADRGTHVAYGALSGEPLPVSARSLIYRQATVTGVWRTRWAQETPLPEVRGALSALAKTIAAGALTLPVEATYDLADWREAIRHTLSHGRFGKVLLTG